MKIIILAGGRGSRLWPLSRQSYPKQFLQIGSEYSLLQKTILRFLFFCLPEDIVIVTHPSYVHHVRKQCFSLGLGDRWNVLAEPMAKGTATAIAFAIRYLQEKEKVLNEELVLVSSSDYVISPEDAFMHPIDIAKVAAKQGSLVTFGVKPYKPETGYGYIQIEKDSLPICKVKRFVEKPDLLTAESYVKNGNYLWNTGIFMFQVGTFWSEIKTHFPILLSLSWMPWEKMESVFSICPEISIDYAVLEKSDNICTVPMQLRWSDVGSWDLVYETLEKDVNQNVKRGHVVSINTENSLIIAEKRLIATSGMKDVIIVETEDALFVGKRGDSQNVKGLVELLSQQHAKESFEHTIGYHFWGEDRVLEEDNRRKIKKMVIGPRRRLEKQKSDCSLQTIVIEGSLRLHIGQEEKMLSENETVLIAQGSCYEFENPYDLPIELILIESKKDSAPICN